MFPLSTENGIKEIVEGEIEGTQNNIAFERTWSPAGLVGSPIFDMSLNHLTSISWIMKDKLPLGNQLTIMFWMKPFNIDEKYFVFVS